MNKKIFIATLVIVGVLFAGQAEAANFFQKMLKRNATSTQVTAGKNIDSACIIKAVEKREAAILKAYDEMSGKISSALSTRSKALLASWGQADRTARVTSRNAAWKDFKDAARGAKELHKTTVRGAWSAYKADAANCRIDVNGVEPENTETEL